jgi:hypothetical protein
MSAENQQERLKTIGWIVGFTDGEGCFTLSIIKNPTTKLGWQVMPEFILTQGEKSLASLKKVQKHFGCGRMETIIIPFFEANELQTAKQQSFTLWSKAVKLINHERIHLTAKGIRRLALIASKINQQKMPKFLESSETIRRSPALRDKI